jgi:hypothetical protein
MATSSVGSSSSSSQASSIQQQIADIQKSINAAMNEAQGGAKADLVQNYQKNSTKSALNTAATATDIGLLNKGKTRLNAFSNLAQRDKVDFVKFRVVQGGNLKMGALGSSTLRFQLMTPTGVVLADNDPKAGKSLNDAFDKLGAGEIPVKAGVYNIKISRRTDAPAATKAGQNYSVQLSMGGYSSDYDTVMKAPAAGTDPYAPPVQVQNVTDMLTQSYQTTASLTYGQSGTDKLLGSMISTSS